jgi:trehalose 6-phosphate synthase/phosphatase
MNDMVGCLCNLTGTFYYSQVRESSLVWNYKYADVEFGRLQARDLLQHLWTGPISNAPVDIVQGSRSVEARPVNVSKGAAMQQMVALMRRLGGFEAVDYEYVLAVGHYLGRDENLFSYFEGKGVGAPGKEGAGGGQHNSNAAQQTAFRVGARHNIMCFTALS